MRDRWYYAGLALIVMGALGIIFLAPRLINTESKEHKQARVLCETLNIDSPQCDQLRKDGHHDPR